MLASFFLLACTEYTPKPLGYNRIDIKEPAYKTYDNTNFSFLYSDLACIDTLSAGKSSDATGLWLNIVYPDYKARIYCSYFSVTQPELKKAMEDSHRLAYGHVLMADGIRQTLYTNKENRVSGIIFDIDGNVATPIQFFLTDSLSNFFRASFYYDAQVNQDSVSPVTELIRTDIVKMLESFRWEYSVKR
ncbi:gliding motility lipoprotein GldD [Viscerimonas tarda]